MLRLAVLAFFGNVVLVGAVDDVPERYPSAYASSSVRPEDAGHDTAHRGLAPFQVAAVLQATARNARR